MAEESISTIVEVVEGLSEKSVSATKKTELFLRLVPRLVDRIYRETGGLHARESSNAIAVNIAKKLYTEAPRIFSNASWMDYEEILSDWISEKIETEFEVNESIFWGVAGLQEVPSEAKGVLEPIVSRAIKSLPVQIRLSFMKLLGGEKLGEEDTSHIISKFKKILVQQIREELSTNSPGKRYLELFLERLNP